MNKLKHISLCILLLYTVSNCAQSKIATKNIQEIEVIIVNFGKCKTLSDEFYYKTGISKKLITSALYVKKGENDELITIPINDEFFDYDNFNETILNENIGKRVKISVEKFFINGEEILVANKVYK